MYGIAITYAVVSLLLLGGFAYVTFKMTSNKWNDYYLYRLNLWIGTKYITGGIVVKINIGAILVFRGLLNIKRLEA